MGVALVVLGLAGRDFALPDPRWREILLLLALTGLALGLRFWQLDQHLRFFVDELSFSNAILDLRANSTLEILRPISSVAAFPYLYPFLQLQGVSLFGRNFVGLRAASAVIGALGIPALYLLAKTLFDRKTALIAALLLATFPPHLHFSRLGLNNIADPLFGTLALAFLARGLMRQRPLDYALGGALLGLTHYFYEGGRLLFTPLAVLWLLGALLIWRTPRRYLLIAVLATLIVALPVYTTLLGVHSSLAARMVEQNAGLSLGYWQSVLASGDFGPHLRDHLAPALLVYTHLPDPTSYYAGDTPLLLVWVVPAFLLGLAYALWRWRSPGPLLLILWLLSVSLGNNLLVDSSASTRFVLVFPALMLLAAVGIRCTLPLIWPEGRWQPLLMAVLVIALALTQAGYYFEVHLPLYEQQRASWPHRDAQDAVLRSLDFPAGTAIHIISAVPPDPNFLAGVLRFMRDDLTVDTVASDEFTADTIAGLQTGIDHAFFIEPDDTATLRLLRNYFTLSPPQASPYDLPADYQFVLYYAESI